MTIHTIALGSFISAMPYNSYYIHKENLGNLSYGGGIIWNKNNNLCLYLPKGGTPVNLWSLEEKGAQLPVYCMLLVKAATEPRVKGREQTPATWWERHWRIRGCCTSFPICFHLKPGVDICPRLLPQPLLYVHQLLQPRYPSLRASGMPLSGPHPAVCLELSPDSCNLKWPLGQFLKELFLSHCSTFGSMKGSRTRFPSVLLPL